MGHGALDIRIEHPVHAFPDDSDMDRVQRIMLATPRPEAIGKSDEVFLVNRLQHLHNGLLDNGRCVPSAFGMYVRLAGRAR